MAYKDSVKKVAGKKGRAVFLFALSTCGWCAKTRELLDNLGIEYRYVYVDLLEEDDQEEVRKEFEEYDTDFAFPKILIDKKKIISGFDESKIKEALA